jgi:hypothetical protein
VFHSGSFGAVVTEGSNVAVNRNVMFQLGLSPIEVTGSSNSITVIENALSILGLSDSKALAVILVNCPSASAIRIEKNTYVNLGRPAGNFSFFVRCFQPEPLAMVFGNLTNTLLPSKVGP